MNSRVLILVLALSCISLGCVTDSTINKASSYPPVISSVVLKAIGFTSPVQFKITSPSGRVWVAKKTNWQKRVWQEYGYELWVLETNQWFDQPGQYTLEVFEGKERFISKFVAVDASNVELSIVERPVGGSKSNQFELVLETARIQTSPPTVYLTNFNVDPKTVQLKAQLVNKSPYVVHGPYGWDQTYLLLQRMQNGQWVDVEHRWLGGCSHSIPMRLKPNQSASVYSAIESKQFQHWETGRYRAVLRFKMKTKQKASFETLYQITQEFDVE